MTPEQTSGHTAALSLSVDDADHPYVTIFYTVERGTIAFTALLVSGIETIGEDKRLLYDNEAHGDTTNPDEILSPLVVGILHPNGNMNFAHGVDIMLNNEQEALSLICVIRALYQMQGELTKEKA